MKEKENNISLEENIFVYNQFKNWLEENYSEENIKRVREDLSTIGSSKVDELKYKVELYLLPNPKVCLQLEGKKFEMEDKKFKVTIISDNDKSS